RAFEEQARGAVVELDAELILEGVPLELAALAEEELGVRRVLSDLDGHLQRVAEAEQRLEELVVLVAAVERPLGEDDEARGDPARAGQRDLLGGKRRVVELRAVRELEARLLERGDDEEELAQRERLLERREGRQAPDLRG